MTTVFEWLQHYGLVVVFANVLLAQLGLPVPAYPLLVVTGALCARGQFAPGPLLLASIEIDGLPCRPCDQRICEPGDFRCLTRIDAPRVIAAAERLLAARRRQASPAGADSEYSQG